MKDPAGEIGARSDSLETTARIRRPWWLPHFLGRVPVGVGADHVSLVGIVALAALFENYDMSMLTSAFKQIRESFDLSQAEASALFAWIRLGAIPAFLVLPLADRIGRRRVFLASILGMSFGTILSGFAQDPVQFVIAQTLTRTFIVASTSCAIVIIAEELPAEHRGWGIGILGALGAFGFGLGAVLYAFVDALPFGWRSMYLVGGVPLMLLPLFRRRVPETRRFLEERAARKRGERGEAGWIAPLVELVREHPGRSLSVAAMAFLFATGSSPAFGLLSDFVQTTHDWAPSDYSLMAILAGTVGIIGNPAMGWAADRLGRRPVAIAGFVAFPIFAAAIYAGPAAGIPLFWIPFVFVLTGANVLLRIVATELFPTSSRNTAMGWETLMETLGGAAGYALVGFLTIGRGVSGDSVAPAVIGIALLTLAAALVVRLVPETAGQELESISVTPQDS